MTRDTAGGVRAYLVVFGALLALTVATVGAASLHMASARAVTVGLAIACVKASLVALYFMHLRHERALVPAMLALTGVIFAGLIALTLASEAGHMPGTRFAPAFDVTEEAR
ncbi:MAG: cytochrome C oxidase subunit IV family protein [Acidobacteriota bacterium]